MSTKIHSTCVISSQAHLEEGVEIGPYTVIKGKVRIGKNTKIGSRVYIEGWTEIGSNCLFYPGCIIGTPPQDVKYKGEKTKVDIGDNSTLREYITINKSTGEGTSTRLGCNNYLMAYSHVAHNCSLGNNIMMANSAALGGHVNVEDKAILGGLVGVHQFVNVGTLSIIGGCSKVVKDVIPFTKVDGHPLKSYGLNVVALRRNKFPEETIHILKESYRIIFRSGLNTSEAIRELREKYPNSEEVKHIIHFIQNSQRGITK